MGLDLTRDVASKTKLMRSENISEDLFDRHFVKNICNLAFYGQCRYRVATEGSKIDRDYIGGKII